MTDRTDAAGTATPPIGRDLFAGAPSAGADVAPELLALLRDPVTRSPLRQEGTHLVAERGGLRYPIREGIPVLIVEEAELPPGATSVDDVRRKVAEEAGTPAS